MIVPIGIFNLIGKSIIFHVCQICFVIHQLL
jgi:hypothetical protein